MATMIILFCILLILLIVCYRLSYRKILLTPQFGFVIGFLISVGYGLFWVKEWNLNLSFGTFMVLAGGVTIFVVTSIIIQQVGTRYRFSLGIASHRKQTSSKNLGIESVVISIERWKLILFVIIQIVVLGMTLYYLLYQVGGGLFGAIYAINSASKTEVESIGFPFLLSQLRYLSFASGFFWAYVLVHSIVFKYRCHYILLGVNIALSIVIYLLGGARQGLVQLIVAIAVMAYLFWGSNKQWTKPIKIRTIIIICVLAVIFVLAYQGLGNLIGRNFYVDSNDYIAAYISAETKNLDIFVRNGAFHEGNSFATTQTFAHLANELAGRFGLPDRALKFNQPYVYVNGHYLGNVYTTFMPFLYDGGYPAVVYYTILMAAILQIVYVRTIKTKIDNRIRLSVIIYSYMFFECLFSFFSAWFYARTFNMTFLYYIIYWILLKLFIERVRINKVKQ